MKCSPFLHLRIVHGWLYGVSLAFVLAVTCGVVTLKAYADNANLAPQMQATVSRSNASALWQSGSSFVDGRRLGAMNLVLAAASTLPGEIPQTMLKTPATRGAETSTRPATTAAGTAAEPAPTSPESGGATVNALLDNLLATGQRMLDLPLYMLLLAVVAVGATLAFVMWRLGGKEGRRGLRRLMWGTEGVLILLVLVWVIDCKIVRLENEMRELRTKVHADALTMLETNSKRATIRQRFLFDAPQAEKDMTRLFGRVKMVPLVYNEVMDLVELRLAEPLAQTWLVIVDLQHPGLEIQLDSAIGKKRLTSDFARENNCTVAINGEAGRSPEPDCGLGEWSGIMVARGHVALQENKNSRPLLALDRQNRATYHTAATANKVVAPDLYNAIWGRSDALVAGQVQVADARFRQPRTAMAINQDGTRLYLLVVDGRQPNYSMGLTRPEVGSILKTFGAHHAMLCDEGGSSCIYLRKFGGISNIPSDGGGKERPTYTHFGLSLRGEEANSVK